MKCKCGGDTMVVLTRTIDGVPKRKRKCDLCGQSFYTIETFLEMASGKPGPKPKPKPPKPMAEKAAEIHRKRVEVRRKNEDRKTKVPSYFIEEEDW